MTSVISNLQENWKKQRVRLLLHLSNEIGTFFNELTPIGMRKEESYDFDDAYMLICQYKDKEVEFMTDDFTNFYSELEDSISHFVYKEIIGLDEDEIEEKYEYSNDDDYIDTFLKNLNLKTFYKKLKEEKYNKYIDKKIIKIEVDNSGEILILLEDGEKLTIKE